MVIRHSGDAPLNAGDHRLTNRERATYLTAEGRGLMEARIALLEVTAAELQEALQDPERRSDVVEAYHRATQELARLRAVVDEAESLEDVPADPRVVEFGDRVLIRCDDDAEEQYLIVDAAEASADDARISVDSPLARALLSRSVGETVTVTVPGGSRCCTILRASRDPQSPAQ